MTALRTWHGGPPPHAGWWNASRKLDDDCWRYWDGRYWSTCVYPDQGADMARINSRVRSWIFDKQAVIKWTDYWPPNAVAARINPDTGEVTGRGPLPTARKRTRRTS